MCEALNKGDGLGTEGEGAELAPRIKVIYPASNPEEVLGYLVDEIGGAWSFEPVKGSES